MLRQSTQCNCKVQDVGFKQVLICSLAHTVATGALPGCKGGSLFGSTSVESVEKGEDKLRTPRLRTDEPFTIMLVCSITPNSNKTKIYKDISNLYNTSPILGFCAIFRRNRKLYQEIDSLFHRRMLRPKKRFIKPFAKWSRCQVEKNIEFAKWNFPKGKNIYDGPQELTCLKAFMVKHLVFRWPKPVLFHGFGGSWYVVEGVPLLEMRGYLYKCELLWIWNERCVLLKVLTFAKRMQMIFCRFS